MSIRLEAGASYAKVGIPSCHIGGINIDSPSLAIGDSYVAVQDKLVIGGNYVNPGTDALKVMGTIYASE